jgi:hypothetical protein
MGCISLAAVLIDICGIKTNNGRPHERITDDIYQYKTAKIPSLAPCSNKMLTPSPPHNSNTTNQAYPPLNSTINNSFSFAATLVV